jgi:hypothetical protein
MVCMQLSEQASMFYNGTTSEIANLTKDNSYCMYQYMLEAAEQRSFGKSAWAQLNPPSTLMLQPAVPCCCMSTPLVAQCAMNLNSIAIKGLLLAHGAAEDAVENLALFHLDKTYD